jgi:demethylmenaquinone methyltransferase / 2-methoxy-6-polyprenyl-1,4-benzoquinol methylase
VNPAALRTASDGSPYPERGSAGFEREVRAMFTHIAGRYDWFDHVASLGNDYVWRPRALWDVDRFRQGAAPARILDAGCGTGDFALLASRHYPGALVVGIDFTAAMLGRAHPRLARHRAGLARASVLHLPFREGTFDLAMSAFVVRNLPDLRGAFREMRRVLAPGGTLATLEITEPDSPTFRALFHAYFDHMVPWLGRAVRSAGPYRYLPESLRFLPSRESMLEMMREVGFGRVEAAPQSFGIVTAYLGEAGDRSGPRSDAKG